MSKNEILEVPSGRIYFGDIIETEFGLFENKDAFLLWASENPSAVAETSFALETARVEVSESGRMLIVAKCADSDCDCSWQVAMSKHASIVRSIKEQGVYIGQDEQGAEVRITEIPAEPDYEETPRNETDCEQVLTLDYKYVEIGTIVR